MANPEGLPSAYDQLLALPENLIGEILDGELFTQPRPASPHALAASALGAELHGPFHRGKGGPGGWIILFEPELHLRGDVFVPDLAAWRRERMPEMPEVAAFELAPDWVCEVLSPSTAARDRARKMPKYARLGVGHLWLIDPILRTLEVYRLEQGRWVLLEVGEDSAVMRCEPFEAIELELAALWAR